MTQITFRETVHHLSSAWEKLLPDYIKKCCIIVMPKTGAVNIDGPEIEESEDIPLSTFLRGNENEQEIIKDTISLLE